MDIRKIFNLFSNDNEEEKLVENLETFKKTPLFKIGMFVKLIMNGINFKTQLLYFFQKSSEDMGMEELEFAGELVMYNRGWYWISQANLDDPEWVEEIKKSANDDFLVAVKLTISFFEEQEEFEKCALLKKIQNIIEESLEV